LRGLLVILVVLTLLVRLVAAQMGWSRLDLVYTYLMYGLALIALVVFQPELRRAIIRAGDVRIGKRRTASNSVVTALVKAAGHLSKHRHGALIAVERRVDLSAWADKGKRIGAEVSGDLLNSIFYPRSPLHDLGVVVRGNRVVAANCQFPATESDEVDLSLGSRHLAALGLSYETDAVILVVSEETGAISIAQDGRLTRGLTTDELSDQLSQRLADTESRRTSFSHVRSRIWRMIRRLILVGPVTASIWYLADQATLARAENVIVQLVAKSASAERIADLTEPANGIFLVTLTGKTSEIDRIRRDVSSENPLRVEWMIDDSARVGELSLPSTQVLGSLPAIRQRALQVTQVNHPEIKCTIDELVTREWPVATDLDRSLIASEQIDPPKVLVTLRRRDLERLFEPQRVVTAAMRERMAAATGPPPGPIRVALSERIGMVTAVRLQPREVAVEVQFSSKVKQREFRRVVVRIQGSPEVFANYDVEKVESGEWLIDVLIEGPVAIIDALDQSAIRAWVMVDSGLAGEAETVTLDVEIDTPAEVKIVSPKRAVRARFVERSRSIP
jgi:diadenylate cyclase